MATLKFLRGRDDSIQQSKIQNRNWYEGDVTVKGEQGYSGSLWLALELLELLYKSTEAPWRLKKWGDSSCSMDKYRIEGRNISRIGDFRAFRD